MINRKSKLTNLDIKKSSELFQNSIHLVNYEDPIKCYLVQLRIFSYIISMYPKVKNSEEYQNMINSVYETLKNNLTKLPLEYKSINQFNQIFKEVEKYWRDSLFNHAKVFSLLTKMFNSLLNYFQ